MHRPQSLAFLPLLLLACSEPFAVEEDGLGTDDSATNGKDSDDTADVVADDITIAGITTGATGLPLAGVTVSGGQSSVVTGADGAFSVTAEAGASLRFSMDGRRSATRTYTHGVTQARVGLLPERVGNPVVADVGGTFTVGDASLALDAGAVTQGVAAVRFDPLDLVSAGLDALPAGVQDASGQVATVLGAVDIAFTGPEGELTLATPARVALPVHGDVTGSTADLLRDVGGSWEVVGSVSIATLGSGWGASFEVSEGGLYAIGRLDSAGCLSGVAVTNTGSPAAGARVLAYVRPDSNAPAAFLDEITAGADGSFCVMGSGGGTSLLVDYTDELGAVWSGLGTVAATGTDDTCADCTDAGNIALAPAGCATGNLYGADGSALPPSPFAWQEGGIVTSTSADGASSVTFYARAGNSFRLRGPAGLSKSFSVSEGSTVEGGTCTRLGNLQAPAGCVAVDVADAGSGLSGVSISTDDGAWTTTDGDGAACAVTEDGTTTFSADWLVGGQAVSQSEVVEVVSSAGGCESGACVEGPSFEAPEAGCVSGFIYGEGGAPASGLSVWSSAFESAVTASDGSYSLATAGVGTAYVWADGFEASAFADQAASAGCTTLNLFADAGAVPDLVVAQGSDIWRIHGDGSTTMLVTDAVVAVVDVLVDEPEDLLLGLLNVYTWGAAADGSGWSNFGSSSSYWSAMRIAPDDSFVALQGYGSTNPQVWLYTLDGDPWLQLSTTAGTDPDGLAFSPDSAWLASTRKDGAVEVTPVSGARGPATIGPTTCGHPLWWDIDTVALDCAGDVMLYEMDGSSSVSWLNSGSTERLWAVTSTGRAVYSVDNELRIATTDLTDEVVLHAGSSGTTFSRVRVSADGLWVAAIVKDPTHGTDILAVADQAPYKIAWLTSTPSETEASIAWFE